MNPEIYKAKEYLQEAILKAILAVLTENHIAVEHRTVTAINDLITPLIKI